MKLQGKANQIVHKRVFKQGQFKIVPWFRFDKDGFAEIDETKVSKVDLDKLNKMFGTESIEPTEEEIRQMARDKGIKSWHVKSIETLKKELGV